MSIEDHDELRAFISDELANERGFVSTGVDRVATKIGEFLAASPAVPDDGLRELRAEVQAMRDDELERGAPTSRLVVESLTRRILAAIDRLASSDRVDPA